ncbi:hypothetical protein [Bradyrhizobium tunisiense]|uniref:hypothetical protein n=1 Tax=Bradyrhizobium tunisiense TaxID=3278709 RepID=UPI0035E0E8C4
MVRVRQYEDEIRLEGVEWARAVEDFRDEIVVIAEEALALDSTNGQEMFDQLVQRIKVVASNQGEAESWPGAIGRMELRLFSERRQKEQLGKARRLPRAGDEMPPERDIAR